MRNTQRIARLKLPVPHQLSPLPRKSIDFSRVWEFPIASRYHVRQPNFTNVPIWRTLRMPSGSQTYDMTVLL
jgi:hypothetical protein